jgi:carbon monoxide dehydrogenase subunit G
MEFVGEQAISAPIDRVWAALNDPEILRRSIPGCKDLERTGESEFTASVVTKVGPVAATFKGKVELADLDPPNGYTLKGRGQGGPAGFAKGVARVRLTARGDDTLLSYSAEIDIGGKLASVGGRMIQTIAKKNADSFFAAFSTILSGGAPPEPDSGIAKAPEPLAALTASSPQVALIDRFAWLGAGVALGMIGMMIFR